MWPELASEVKSESMGISHVLVSLTQLWDKMTQGAPMEEQQNPVKALLATLQYIIYTITGTASLMDSKCFNLYCTQANWDINNEYVVNHY